MKKINSICFVLLIILISCNSEQTTDSEKNEITNEKIELTNKDNFKEDTKNTSTDSLNNKVASSISVIEKGTAEGAQNHTSDEVKKQGKNNTLTENSPSAYNKPTSVKIEAKKFCDFFKSFDEPSQFFNVPANEIKEVKGKAGTVILVNPNDLSTLQNNDVEKNIEVELKELTQQEQLLRANAQTICNGKLLISGGAYYINLKSEGQPLKLKSGKSLAIKFPKLTDAPMALFAGYRDSLGQMQWQERKLLFRADPLQQAWRDTRNTIIQYDGDILEIDTLPKRKKQKEKSEIEKKKEQAYEKVYAAMDIQSLGWINCDRFYNVQEKTILSVTIEAREKITFASIYLVFDDINSIIQTHYGATDNGVSNPGFENIPVGAKARLIAFALKQDKLIAHSSNITIKKNETITIALKETTDEELKTLFKKN